MLPLPAVIPDARWVVFAGLTLVVFGVGIGLTGILTFRKFRTAVLPHRPASVLVDTGIYAFTRNPMYTGLTLLITQVIRREERYLGVRFPEAYAEYCARVGRWI